ncbi:MAG TPA: DeoR/GlpR family DNA-binding transcription regulator [Candidatus Limnocylindrales bacterium]
MSGRAGAPTTGAAAAGAPAVTSRPPGGDAPLRGPAAPGALSARDRRDQIERLVAEQERVSVADLTRRFLVTEASIRRDLVILEGEGRLRRVHGGAVGGAASRHLGIYAEKSRERREEKARIGAAAAAMISVGDVVFLDSGTTVAAIASGIPGPLRRSNAITVVTPSLPVVEAIGAWESPHLICLGGLYLPDYRAVVGPQTVAGLRELSADIVFLGCEGLTIEEGLTTPHVLVAEVGATMAARARRVVVVADSSKLGQSGFTPIIPIQAVDALVTDSGASAVHLERIRAAGVEVIIA